MNDVNATPTPSLTLPRGSWYLLEGVCQKPAPWTTTVLTTRAAKLWSKLHKANPAVASGFKFEKRIIKNEGESDASFAVRVDASGEAFDAWQKEGLTLPISAKEKATLEKGIGWALKNRDKAFPENNDLILAILTTFDVSGAEDEEETA